MMTYAQEIITLCGVGHLLLGFGSLFVPKMLQWNKTLQNVPVLIRQIFWTYAGYILGINLFFGIVSILFAKELVSGSKLAFSLTLFITLYWCARLLIQFFYFDKRDLPNAFIYRLGEILLTVLFIVFTLVYGWAFYLNCSV